MWNTYQRMLLVDSGAQGRQLDADTGSYDEASYLERILSVYSGGKGPQFGDIDHIVKLGVFDFVQLEADEASYSEVLASQSSASVSINE